MKQLQIKKKKDSAIKTIQTIVTAVEKWDLSG